MCPFADSCRCFAVLSSGRLNKWMPPESMKAAAGTTNSVKRIMLQDTQPPQFQ